MNLGVWIVECLIWIIGEVAYIAIMLCYFVSGSPSQPVIMTDFSDPSSVKMANISGITNIILNISWMGQSSVDHYEIQIDNHLPILVQNTTFLTIQESSLEANHIIQLTAVDSCDRRSDSTVVNNINLMHYIAASEQEQNPVTSSAAPTMSSAAPSTDKPSNNDEFEANSRGNYECSCIYEVYTFTIHYESCTQALTPSAVHSYGLWLVHEI